TTQGRRQLLCSTWSPRTKADGRGSFSTSNFPDGIKFHRKEWSDFEADCDDGHDRNGPTAVIRRPTRDTHSTNNTLSSGILLLDSRI
ncbi:hypothetical protein, partial [Shinella sedimenti]